MSKKSKRKNQPISELEEKDSEEEYIASIGPKETALIAAAVAFIGGGSIAAMFLPAPPSADNVTNGEQARSYINEAQQSMVLYFLAAGAGSALIFGGATRLYFWANRNRTTSLNNAHQTDRNNENREPSENS